MFDALTDRLSGVFRGLRGRGKISEENVAEVMREIRTALLDASCGLAVFLAMPNPQRIATIDLRIDYMGPAPPGKNVVCRAECYKLTRHVAFTRAVAYISDPEDAVATAAGSFMIFDGDLSPMARELKS